MRFAPPMIAAACFLLLACGSSQSSQANNVHATALNAAAPAAISPSVMTKRVSGADAARVMHDRHDAMGQLGKAMKELHRALDASDVNAVRAQTATMASIAPKIPAMFPSGSGPDAGKTRAKPEIWQQQSLFLGKAKDFVAATRAIDAAAKAGDMNKVMALHDDVDKACDACHKPFRAPEH